MTKPPSWNEIRANARQFVPRWAGTTSEQGESQAFWIEFLAIFGVDRRRVASFERRVRRTSTGKDGRIDLFWPGTLVVEQKSAGRSLDDAEQQALDYLDDLEDDDLPQVIITSNFSHFRLLDLRYVGSEPVTIRLEDLPQEIERFGFIAGYERHQSTAEQESAANIEAAQRMANLYEALAEDGYPDHDASVLLARLLFLMFGDDTGMWLKGLFHDLVDERTSKDGSDLGAQLSALFQVLNTPENRRGAAVDEHMSRFPYVNGGLFGDAIRFPFFTRQMRARLLESAQFDWSRITPAVFGSMFQAVKDKEARRLLGEHYTTEKNILRLIRPLFLDDLRQRFEAGKNDPRRLRELRRSLSRLRFLDPACGCGNFLVVAYRELRRLELDILVRLRVLAGKTYQQDVLDPTVDLQVSLTQFFGIELEEWPAQIAETAMFLVDHQANLELAEEFGVAPDRLPLKASATIVRGNATRLDWREVVGGPDVELGNLVILGNPPFVGMAWMSSEQQEDNRVAFAELDTAGLRTGRLDYVACWYAKAVQLLAGTRGRAAFVSTNSITQGEQARSMVPLLARYGLKVDFGHRTFKWTSEAPSAAAVHVVIVGFSGTDRTYKPRLFDYPKITSEPVETQPSRLNFYLVDAPDIVPVKVSAPLVPGMPFASKGSQPTDHGNLIVDEANYAEFAADPVARRYLRRYVQAKDLLRGGERWCLWLVDAPPADLRGSRVLHERLEAVRAARLASPTASVRDQASSPSLFTQIRQPHQRYLALPEVSSETREWIPGAFLAADVIAGNKLIVWDTDRLWHFAYLQSSAWMAWVRAYAGRLKSDFSLSPGLAYFPFPFVIPTDAQRASLEKAAQAVLDERARHAGATLADLYDPLSMPGPLIDRHHEIDGIVDGFYSLRRPTESQRLAAIMKSYNELVAPLEAARRRPRRRLAAARPEPN
ncbi:class I SAM-dependent DNA methyltransferase [Isoptericola sp. b490]|uniref:class I SAM-dependent DNA methyltransferase n=1 Tax=Actinotalea lenta TaxID=3064654 RepID=UPI002712B96D|nr:DNA methyltransferase [Isoptericola sp. b490]MDO8122327.1 class I SAM-dependent DNA methyltransferase [Isoptericola sp. b490]